MDRLKGKIAVITGCSTGLGKQTAIRFAEEGAALAICARTESRLMETKRICEEKGVKVLAYPCDLSDAVQVKGFVDAITKEFGRVDILVNNACAATLSRPFLEQTVDDLMLPINTGLIPTWMMMQLCFPLMKERGGSIINLGSGSEEGLAGFSAYGSIKSAISALTRTVAIEFGSYNIRVNNVYPTGLTEKMTGALDREVSKEALDYIVSGMAQNALKRAGDPYKDVSPVFLFLASDDSSYVTGQGLYVDGGAVIHR